MERSADQQLPWLYADLALPGTAALDDPKPSERPSVDYDCPRLIHHHVSILPPGTEVNRYATLLNQGFYGFLGGFACEGKRLLSNSDRHSPVLLTPTTLRGLPCAQCGERPPWEHNEQWTGTSDQEPTQKKHMTCV